MSRQFRSGPVCGVTRSEREEALQARILPAAEIGKQRLVCDQRHQQCKIRRKLLLRPRSEREEALPDGLLVVSPVRAALQRPIEVFMTAPSPGILTRFIINLHYPG